MRVSPLGVWGAIVLLASVFWGALTSLWSGYTGYCDALLARIAIWAAFHGIRFVLNFSDRLRPWFAASCFVGVMGVLYYLAKHVRRLYGEARAYLRARRLAGTALPLAPLFVEARDVRIVANDGENGLCLEIRVDGTPVRVALDPIQSVALLATSIPQNQSRGKEMAIPGKIPQSVPKLPDGLVSLRVGTQIVGMGFRMSFNRSTYLVTATHVLDNARAYDLLMVGNGQTHPVERSWKVALQSKASQLDITMLCVPQAVWSVLQVKALTLGAVSSQVVRAVKVYGYSKLGKPQYDFGDAVANKNSLFSLTHTSWTQPSYSGSPLIADGKVLAVHTGASPSGPASNKATSLACLLTFLRKETPWKGDAWSEISQEEMIAMQNERASEMEELIMQHQFDDEESAVETRLTARGFEYSRDDIRLEARGIRRWADEDIDETIPDPDKVWEEFRTPDMDEQSHVNTTRKRGPLMEPIRGDSDSEESEEAARYLARLKKEDPYRAPKTPRQEDKSELILPSLTNVQATRVTPLPPPALSSAPLVVQESVEIKRQAPRKPLPPVPVRGCESAMILPPPPVFKTEEEYLRGKESLKLGGPVSEASGPQISKSSAILATISGSTKVNPLVPAAASDSKGSASVAAGSPVGGAKSRRRRQRSVKI